MTTFVNRIVGATRQARAAIDAFLSNNRRHFYSPTRLCWHTQSEIRKERSVLRHRAGYLARQFDEGGTRRMIGMRQNERHPVVAGLADFREDWHPGEDRHRFCTAHFFAAAMAERFIALAAIRADKIAHIFDYAEQRAVHLPKHPHRAQGVGQRNLLRRSHDDDTVERHLLRQRELSITSARRQVNDQKILSAPERVLEKLTHCTHYHRAAPDDRRLLVEEKADRNQFDAVAVEWIEVLTAG